MIRSKLSNRKIEELIKKGGSIAKKKEMGGSLMRLQLRIPPGLVKEIDIVVEKSKEKNHGVKQSRHDFLMKWLLEAVEREKSKLKIKSR